MTRLTRLLLLLALGLGLALPEGMACGLLGSRGSGPDSGGSPEAGATSTTTPSSPTPSSPAAGTATPALSPPRGAPALIVVNPASELNLHASDLPEGWRILSASYVDDWHVVRLASAPASEGVLDIMVSVRPGTAEAASALAQQRNLAADSGPIGEPGVGSAGIAYERDGAATLAFTLQNVVSLVVVTDGSLVTPPQAQAWAERLASRIERVKRIGVALEPEAAPTASVPTATAPIPPTPTRTRAPAAPPTATPTATATPRASAPTVAPSIPSPTPTAAPPAPTPTPTPTPSASTRHQVTLVQATRLPSPGHAGWMEVTLGLAVVKAGEGTAASRIEVWTQDAEVCLVNVQPPHDCISVVWGSQEQFTAPLLASHGQGRYPWPAGKVWPLNVTFEMPVTADRASVVVGDRRLPIPLQDDKPSNPYGRAPSPAPTPAPAVGGTGGAAGYFTADGYGVAIVSLTRAPDARLTTWANVTLKLAVVPLAKGEALAASIKVATANDAPCLVAAASVECFAVTWGGEQGFQAALASDRLDGTVEWPRGKGWPVTLSFLVPDGTGSGVLRFGDHEVPLDLFGMSGAAPAYDYRAHYASVEPGARLYDADGKRVTLLSVDDDAASGSLVLRFAASNGSENADFAPVVRGKAARIAAGGAVFDGVADPARGWTPPPVEARGPVLAPGTSGDFSLELPRVGGGPFTQLSFGADRPDAVLLRLEVADAMATSAPQQSPPGFVPFQRADAEVRFWLPDLAVTAIEWTPSVPTVGKSVTVSVTVGNVAAFASTGASVLAFDVGGVKASEATLSPIAPGDSVVKKFTWTADQTADTFGAVADPKDTMEERDETNNRLVVRFGGAFLPDLAAADLAWQPSRPSAGQTVTFTLSVSNLGKGRVDASVAHVYLDAETQARWSPTIPAIEGQAVGVATFTWTAAPGSHVLRVVADGPAAVPEADENNNIRSFVYDATLLADLVVKDLKWAPERPSLGDTGVFTIYVENLGPGDAGSFVASVYLDDSAQPGWKQTVPGLRAGQATTQTFSWAAQAGQHKFKVVADGDGIVPETDETNNGATFSYSHTRLPDLMVTEVSWAPELPSVGDPVTFTIKLGNQGEGDSPGFAVYVYLDAATQPTWTISSPRMPAGANASFTLTWAAAAGPHNFRVVADAASYIAETDETNNERTALYRATLLPDLLVESLTWDPAAPLAGDTATFTLRVKNQGQGASPPFETRVYLDGSTTVGWVLSFAKILPGVTVSAGFTWQATSGSHSFRAVVDGAQAVVETDETNNERTVTVP